MGSRLYTPSLHIMSLFHFRVPQNNIYWTKLKIHGPVDSNSGENRKRFMDTCIRILSNYHSISVSPSLVRAIYLKNPVCVHIRFPRKRYSTSHYCAPRLLFNTRQGFSFVSPCPHCRFKRPHKHRISLSKLQRDVFSFELNKRNLGIALTSRYFFPTRWATDTKSHQCVRGCMTKPSDLVH